MTLDGMPRIDLNCDMGEGFGAYRMGDDLAILDHVTSANIACGFHAGDPATMHATVAAALAKGVAVGAHPGLPDLQGFGRRTMKLTAHEAYDLMVYQVGALAGFARALGGRLSHVKAHGALYNMAARDYALSEAMAQAVHDVDRELLFVGLAGSETLRAATAVGLRPVSEVFGDRTYQADGSLTPRGRPDAMIEDLEVACAQVRRMVSDGVVRATSGEDVRVRADSLCIHGDQPGALDFVKRIRSELQRDGVSVVAIRDDRPSRVDAP